MRSMRSPVAITATFLTLAILILTVLVTPATAATPRRGELHITKECSAYTGLAGGYCTFTSSNLRAITVGSKIYYASAAGATSLDSDVVIKVRDGSTASGHCTLDFATSTGKCTFWKGTGTLRGFHASVKVTYHGGRSFGPPRWHWDGTYRFSRERRHVGPR